MDRHANRIEPRENGFNPYAPPRDASEETAPGVGIWRKGRLVIAPRDSALPHRCIKCNAPAAPRLKRQRLYWHKWGWYLLIFFNLLIYALVALFVRERASVHLGLCKRHWQRRRAVQAGALLLLAASLALIVTGAVDDDSGRAMLGVCGTLVSVLVALFGLALLRAQRIEGPTMRLRGCSQAFLASLPEYPGPD